MNRPIRVLLPVAALWLASSARATDLAYVKCAVNQDRVWVYESLGSFDVEARLRCGAPVEILSRVKGYVKIRTESGVEGFIPDSALPDLPALPDESEKTVASAAPPSSATRMPTSASVVSTPAQPLVTAKAQAAEPETVLSASVSAAAPIPVKATVPPAPTPSATASVSVKTSTSSAEAKPATAVVKKTEVAPGNPSATSSAHGPVTTSNATVAPARPSVETVSTSARDSGALVPAKALPSRPIEESDDYPDTQPENESADPACRVYFAAYGLAPSQYKWLAENRRKEFSGICPAPDVAHVDYVVLFTHDSDSYSFAMPTPVHTDRSGFSDFSPLTPVDTALVRASEVERAHYEFVWVFRVTRGAFDPEKFSARRRPQFTTTEKGSRAPSRAVEDAFNFVETQNLNR